MTHPSKLAAHLLPDDHYLCGSCGGTFCDVYDPYNICDTCQLPTCRRCIYTGSAGLICDRCNEAEPPPPPEPKEDPRILFLRDLRDLLNRHRASIYAQTYHKMLTSNPGQIVTAERICADFEDGHLADIIIGEILATPSINNTIRRLKKPTK